MAVSLKVNGATRMVPAEPDTPLLYVLRNDLALNGAKFGCGLAQCGACTVLVDGKAVRSCVTDGCLGRKLRDHHARGPRHAREARIPLQKAFIEEQAAQCGYCINGMIMSAKVLLDRKPHPTEAEVRQASPTICAVAAPTIASSAPSCGRRRKWGGPDMNACSPGASSPTASAASSSPSRFSRAST